MYVSPPTKTGLFSGIRSVVENSCVSIATRSTFGARPFDASIPIAAASLLLFPSTVTVDFKSTSLAPRMFLGANGFQYDFEHLDSDEVRRRGRAVGAVIDGRLYLILLDATRSHYFNASLGDYEAIVNSARRVR